jgi:pimeloyl-ACP methyl ester carboxylesterase
MANKLLIVPGMTGCKLLLNDEDVGWPSELTLKAILAGEAGGFGFKLDSLKPDSIVETLSMEYLPDSAQWQPMRTTLKANSEIKPGPTLELAYNQLTDFGFFEYDWRADIRESGRLLMEYLKQNMPENGQWKIIGHSLGGLVTIVASKLYARENNDSDTAFSQLASHVVLLASPLDGTMVAADAIINGDNLSGGFSTYFKEIVRTWPSLHQMLPAWYWSVKKIVNGAEIDDDYCLQDDAPWIASKPEISLSMLQRARDARKDFFRAPLSRMNNVKTKIIMSRAWATNNHVVRDALNNLTVSNAGEPGDTSVPEETVRKMAEQIELDRMLSFGDDKETQKHALVGCDPVIAAAVKDFFNQ